MSPLEYSDDRGQHDFTTRTRSESGGNAENAIATLALAPAEAFVWLHTADAAALAAVQITAGESVAFAATGIDPAGADVTAATHRSVIPSFFAP